jgi:homoserine dehydrogenase
MTTGYGKRVFEIVQFGMGGVGRALFGLIVQHEAEIRQRLGIELRYRALADSSHVLHLDDTTALSRDHLQHLWASLNPKVAAKLETQAGAVRSPGAPSVVATELARLKSTSGGANLIVVDVSGASAEQMIPALTAVLRNGQRVVLANKRPLCGPYEDFKLMTAAAGLGWNRLRYETTVGAALPIISSLRSLLDSFDTIQEISGTFSGTLGYLFTRLEEGALYSEAVSEAKANGYTEPDPRDDLGGIDVARKALILARSLGYPLELEAIEVEPLYNHEMQQMSIPEFMTRVTDLDKTFAQRVSEAAAKGDTLRYVAQIKAEQCRVGIAQVGRSTPLGQLRGTDNLVQFLTGRYHTQPLVVQGAGAGPELTASGVLADILSFAH